MNEILSILQPKKEKQPVYLYSIFEMENGRYTNSALLYQDIICYISQLDIDKKIKENQHPSSFLFYDLASWLVTARNKEFVNYYQDSQKKVNTSNRIACRRQKIQRHIDDLQDLGLIYYMEDIPARRNNSPTPLYVYFPNAILLSWIMKYSSTDNKQIKNELLDQIYNFIRVRPHDNKSQYQQVSAKRRFISLFYETCYKNGLFDQLIDRIIQILHSDKLKLKNIYYLFHLIAYHPILETNKKYQSRISKAFFAALNQMDDDSRKLVIMHEKVDIEKATLRRLEFDEVYDNESLLNQWENLWMENISNNETLTLITV